MIKLVSDPIFKVHFSICPTSKFLVCKSIDFLAPSATLKVDPEMLVKFVNDVCMKIYESGQIVHITENSKINLHQHYFCAETIRDIYANIISDLQLDNSEYSTNEIASFGFLAGDSKPQRLKYIQMCKSFSQLNYISTEKFNRYSKNSPNFTSVAKLKKDYKYLIDLKGHSYSTKTYQFLASKRVYFSSEHNEVLNWEASHLNPWENYIPVKSDLSDLMEKYQIIESDPGLYKKIIKNNINLLENELSPEFMLKELAKKIISCISFCNKQ